MARLVDDAARRLRSRGIDDARLEAEVMLAAAMGVDRTHLLARLHDEVPVGARPRFEAMVVRRLAREPLAYVLGHREFYDVEIECGPGALIPRPESELLVDLALDEIASRNREVRVADVGTGSGALAVAIALNAGAARVTAIDASSEALAVAHRNVARYGLPEQVTLAEGDLLAGTGVFDIVVANLPYVAEDEWRSLQTEIREYEPRTALVAGAAGTEIIERLLRTGPEHLAAGGLLAAEIGCTQGAHLLHVARQRAPDATCNVMKDLAGRDRALVVRKQRGG